MTVGRSLGTAVFLVVLPGCASSPDRAPPQPGPTGRSTSGAGLAEAPGAPSSATAVPSNGKNRGQQTTALAAGLEAEPNRRDEAAHPPTPTNGGDHVDSEALEAEDDDVEYDDGDPAPEPRSQAYPIPPPKQAPPLDPKAATKAKKLIQRARSLYSKGEYDRAEIAIKEAITMHPFLAEANLLLGKIFLIRGSATRDRAMINSARLMFEMARALDPELREPAVLLELFLAAPPE